jgi:hypothetical protein
MKPVTIKLPEELRVRLQAEADKRGVSLGQVVREAAAAYVAASPVQTRLSAYDLSKDLCGSLDGGPGDLSTNPKYLEDLGLDSMGDSRYRAAGGVSRKKGRPARVGD